MSKSQPSKPNPLSATKPTQTEQPKPQDTPAPADTVTESQVDDEDEDEEDEEEEESSEPTQEVGKSTTEEPSAVSVPLGSLPDVVQMPSKTFVAKGGDPAPVAPISGVDVELQMKQQVREHLTFLSVNPAETVTVQDFRFRFPALGAEARRVLEVYMGKGYVGTRWVGTANRYSLTAAGQDYLSQLSSELAG